MKKDQISERVKPYHEAPEKTVYNLERPERDENSEDFETEMGAERTHHDQFEETPEVQNFDLPEETPDFEMFFKRGEGLADSQNFGQSEPSRSITRSQTRRNTESEGREQSIMPQLCRASIIKDLFFNEINLLTEDINKETGLYMQRIGS